ncbi:MAG: hypothetical protein EOO41_01345, partial [Methanobacteriota archaeon]
MCRLPNALERTQCSFCQRFKRHAARSTLGGASALLLSPPARIETHVQGNVEFKFLGGTRAGPVSIVRAAKRARVDEGGSAAAHDGDVGTALPEEADLGATPHPAAATSSAGTMNGAGDSGEPETAGLDELVSEEDQQRINADLAVLNSNLAKSLTGVAEANYGAAVPISPFDVPWGSITNVNELKSMLTTVFERLHALDPAAAAASAHALAPDAPASLQASHGVSSSSAAGSAVTGGTGGGARAAPDGGPTRYNQASLSRATTATATPVAMSSSAPTAEAAAPTSGRVRVSLTSGSGQQAGHAGVRAVVGPPSFERAQQAADAGAAALGADSETDESEGPAAPGSPLDEETSAVLTDERIEDEEHMAPPVQE